MKSIALITGVLLATLIAAAPRASADRVGGGGSYVVVDGSIQLSDPFYRSVGQEHLFSDFQKPIQDYLANMETLLNNLGMQSDKLWSEMRNIHGVYVMVPPGEENTVPCKLYLPPLNQPVSEHFQYGCTKGTVTYLFEAFKKANVREQAKAILHERLWTLNPEVDQRFVAHFSTILAKFGKLHEDQVLKGNRDLLTENDLNDLDLLAMSAAQLNFMIEYKRKDIILNGGGRIINHGPEFREDSTIDNKSFVSLTSTVRRSDLISTTVIDSSLSGCDVSFSEIANANLAHETNDKLIVHHSKISDFALKYPELRAEFAIIEDVRGWGGSIEISGTAKNISRLRSLELDGGNLRMGPGAVARDLSLKDSLGWILKVDLGAGSALSDVSVTQPREKWPANYDEGLAAITLDKNSTLKNLAITPNWNTDQTLVFKSTTEFASGHVFDFANLNCKYNKPKLVVNNEADLKAVCE